MKKYINALRFGSSKAKRFLWSIIGLSILTIGLIAASFFGGSMIMGVSAIFSGVLTGVITQSATFKSIKIQDKLEKLQKKQRENQDSKESESENEDYLEKYTQDYIDQLFVIYKVKKTVKTVMIDKSEKNKIYQCPTYIWCERGKIHLLLLEKKPRKITIPRHIVTELTVDQVVITNGEEDYKAFEHKGLISMVFSPFLPTCYDATKRGRKVMMKNLYCIASDIKFTNTSAKTVMNLLEIDIKLEDDITKSMEFSSYFKKIYRSNFLLKDNVIEVKEYKKRMQTILRMMTMNIKEKTEFEHQLNLMLKYHLITTEYADFYSEQWNHKKVNNK